MTGSYIIPTALGLAVAQALEELEDERLFLEAIIKLRALAPLARIE